MKFTNACRANLRDHSVLTEETTFLFLFLPLPLSPPSPPPIGPSVQTDVAQSAPAIDTTLSFAPSDSALSVNFDLSNDAVALEAVESFSVGLEVVTAPADLNVTVSGPATINVVDDDCRWPRGERQ